MTRLIGAIAIRRDEARTRSERKQLARLVSDLCVIARGLDDVQRAPKGTPLKEASEASDPG